MIAFGAYLLLFLSLIWFNGFFGILKDDKISRKEFTLLFLLKALAVPAFYYAYKKLYGGLGLFDAGKFYHDASVISDFAKADPIAYIRLMLGLQDDAPGSYDFVSYLRFTDNWDNGQLKDYLYNDNRIVIRLHSLLHFAAFNSYFVHALFSCFLSYIGIVLLYRSVSNYFEGKELQVLLVLCFFPALWFYTGAVLKESIAIFILGCQASSLKKILGGRQNFKPLASFILLFLISFLLKPYLLLFCTLCFFLLFLLEHRTNLKYKSVAFFSALLGIILLVNIASVLMKNKTLLKAVTDHQRVFADASKGGIFLFDGNRFIRLRYDTALVKKVAGSDSVYTVARNASYIYWELMHQQDTLHCAANSDTLTRYRLMYMIGESRSNIDQHVYQRGAIAAAGAALYYSLFYPFFFNAAGPMHLLASCENLLLIASLLIIVAGLIRNKKSALLPLVLLSMALAICLLAGLATPNSGAIFRYRSPVAVFILLGALYYLPSGLNKKPRGNYQNLLCIFIFFQLL